MRKQKLSGSKLHSDHPQERLDIAKHSLFAKLLKKPNNLLSSSENSLLFILAKDPSIQQTLKMIEQAKATRQARQATKTKVKKVAIKIKKT